MSQAITYPDIPGIKWVYNRSDKGAEVQWDMQVVILPAHTVTPIPNAHARQAIARGTYQHFGTPEAHSFLVIPGMEGFNEPLSEEEQCYLDGTDPIKHSRIDLRPENDTLYGPAKAVKVIADNLPTSGPRIDKTATIAAVGSR